MPWLALTLSCQWRTDRSAIDLVLKSIPRVRRALWAQSQLSGARYRTESL